MAKNRENIYQTKHLRSQQTAMHVPIFSGVLQCSAEEVRFVWPSPLYPPHQLNVVRIQYHHVLGEMGDAVPVQQAVSFSTPSDSLFQQLLKGWHAGAMLDQAGKVREDIRSGNFLVGSRGVPYCRSSSGCTPSAKMRPQESRTHKRCGCKNCSHDYAVAIHKVNHVIWKVYRLLGLLLRRYFEP